MLCKLRQKIYSNVRFSVIESFRCDRLKQWYGDFNNAICIPIRNESVILFFYDFKPKSNEYQMQEFLFYFIQHVSSFQANEWSCCWFGMSNLYSNLDIFDSNIKYTLASKQVQLNSGIFRSKFVGVLLMPSVLNLVLIIESLWLLKLWNLYRSEVKKK